MGFKAVNNQSQGHENSLHVQLLVLHLHFLVKLCHETLFIDGTSANDEIHLNQMIRVAAGTEKSPAPKINKTMKLKRYAERETYKRKK